MKARCSSGPYAMSADHNPGIRPFRVLPVAALALWFVASAAAAADAPLPVPPEAEAAYQDLREKSGAGPADPEKQLDEAIFTEISALTIPEIGIALPADQEH